MDLKHKGITWVGNMFQKFEAVCQEVDNIISQDTVKYVENQVGSASENVKKLYSGVVQGLLPPVRDTVKCEAKAAAQTGRVPINAGFKSSSLNEGKTANHVVNKSSVGHGISVTDQMDNRSQASCEGNNDVVYTDNDASKSSEEDTTMEFNSSDPLKHMVNRTSAQAKVTNGEAIQIFYNSHLPLESSRLSRKNDNDLSDEKPDEFSKKVVIMEPNSTDNLNNNDLSHVCSETNFLNEEADDFNSLLMVESLPGRTDHALIDKDFNESPIKDAISEDDPSSNLLILPGHGNGISFIYEEAIMVSESNHLQLEPELQARMNEDALTDKYSNGSLKEDTLLELEHDASYPLKNQPSCTSNCIKYKNEEVSSDSNDYYLKLESEVYCGKNSEALMDKASDASCKEHANFELSTELISQCDEESVMGTLGSRDNECEEDIVTSTEGSLVTSIHGADVESTHNGRQASSILANSSVNISQKMETTSKYLENGTGSSNAPDATSELVSLVLTSAETVEETRPVSSLKSLPKSSFSASKSLVKNFSSCTVVHEKPADQRASIEYESRPCFEVVTSASNENKALKMKFDPSSSSLSSMESLDTHASRANESAFLPKFRTSSQVAFSESTSSGAISRSTEVGRSHNSRCNILDAEMETVDLGHQATLKAECDIVDYKALHAVSRRTQKLRSYRKRIQDAFNSKKRLAKEYEQLAIWYGDIDEELSTDSSQKLDTKNASTSYASDSEWELL